MDWPIVNIPFVLDYRVHPTDRMLRCLKIVRETVEHILAAAVAPAHRRCIVGRLLDVQVRVHSQRPSEVDKVSIAVTKDSPGQVH